MVCISFPGEEFVVERLRAKQLLSEPIREVFTRIREGRCGMARAARHGVSGVPGDPVQLQEQSSRPAEGDPDGQ